MIGLESVIGRVQAMSDRADAALRKAALEAAQAAAESARAAAPVRTGALRASLSFSPTADGAEAKTNCGYAALVEWGTRYIPARPFLLPGAQAADFFGRAAAGLKEVIR